MWIVHLFDPTDLATMFRLEGQYPSRGKIAGIEVSYLQRNNKLVGFAFRSVASNLLSSSCFFLFFLYRRFYLSVLIVVFLFVLFFDLCVFLCSFIFVLFLDCLPAK